MEAGAQYEELGCTSQGLGEWPVADSGAVAGYYFTCASRWVSGTGREPQPVRVGRVRGPRRRCGCSQDFRCRIARTAAAPDARWLLMASRMADALRVDMSVLVGGDACSNVRDRRR